MELPEMTTPLSKKLSSEDEMEPAESPAMISFDSVKAKKKKFALHNYDLVQQGQKEGLSKAEEERRLVREGCINLRHRKKGGFQQQDSTASTDSSASTNALLSGPKHEAPGHGTTVTAVPSEEEKTSDALKESEM